MLIFVFLKFWDWLNAGQLPNSAKLYGEILLNGFQQPLPHGTYVSPFLSRSLLAMSHFEC